MSRIGRLIAKSTALTVLLLNSTAFAAVTAADQGNVAIGGYSPVSYFTENKAELGREEYAVEHDGKVYFLTSQQQINIFDQDPDKYRPKHRSCPYSLAYGMVLPIDPKSFKIVGGELLLFHRSEQKNALLEWNASTLSEEELLRRADANVFRIDF